MIDTAAISHDSGTLEVLKMREFAKKNLFREVSSVNQIDASGQSTSLLFQGERLSLGRFSVAGPVLGETPVTSVLGLRFWSRFVVTFDFPRRRLFLREGKSFGRPDSWNRSGLHLLKKDRDILVDSVDKASAGDRAGIRAGDGLLSLADMNAETTTLFKLRAVLCQKGTVSCVIRRGSHDRQVSIDLGN
jgi:hypothetical protein